MRRTALPFLLPLFGCFLVAQPAPILKVMEEELNRSFQGLAKLEIPPYYLGYSVTDVQRSMLSASHGAIINRATDRSRLLDIDVRVGNHELDSTHPLRGDVSFSPFGIVLVPLDDDPDSLKTVLWLETDKRYKEAVQNLIKVKTNVAVKVKEEDTAGDFTLEEPQVSIGEPAKINFDEALWSRRICEFSAIFKGFPQLHASNVSLQITTTTRYMVTNEGTRLQFGKNNVRLSFMASAKAEDGMEVRSFDSFDGTTLAAIPDDATVRKAIQIVINEALGTKQAPLVEPFSGPAILAGRAAGVFFHELFGHRIEGHRQKRVEQGQTFARKIGEKIAPEFISVYSDPTLSSVRGKEVNGHYPFDDEGVKSRRVALIEDGTLKNFLLSRNPVQSFLKSNGHGRRQPGARIVARQANLLVESKKTVPVAELRRMLIEECKKQAKSFGLLFKEVEGGFTFTGRVLPNMFNVRPVVVYRVYVDGRPDELVRGVDMVGTPLMVFGKILAAGDDLGVFNGYCGAESGIVPVAAASPSLLVSEIEVQKKEKSQERIPILPPPATEARTAVEESAVLRALTDELARSKEKLQLENLERPYFIAYSLHDTESLNLDAVFGGLKERRQNRQRYLKVQVRVGDYQLDNTGFVGRGGMGFRQGFQVVALEDDYDALRRSVWLATDQAYKDALENLSRKKAHLKNVAAPETVPDFSKEEPVEVLEKPSPIRPIQADTWVDYVKHLSALFRNYPQIQHSRVLLRVKQEQRLYVNSEGSKIIDSRPLATLQVYASTKSDDGHRLEHYLPISVPLAEQLPDRQVVEKRVRALAEELTALRTAPLLETYTGPVMFSGAASAELFRVLLARNVAGNREPLSDMPQMPTFFDLPGSPSPTSQFITRLNTRVLPDFLSAVDDASQTQYEGTPLLGSYAADDEGVKARRISVVEKGILKSVVTSRRPIKEIMQSTGHGRASLMSQPAAVISNLIISSGQNKTSEDLKKDLIQLCRDDGKEFGLLIQVLDNPAVPRELSSMFMMPRPDQKPTKGVFIGYKVYADGREEPVRLGSFSGIDIRVLRDIAAASQQSSVHNVLIGETGFTMFGAPPGIPASIVAPAVLIKELDFQKPELGKEKMPHLPHPYFK